METLSDEEVLQALTWVLRRVTGTTPGSRPSNTEQCLPS